jgi:preprotein translocase SecE subunit
VRSTTVVVVATTFFFGFYLWGLDVVFSEVLARFLKR